MYQYVYSEPSTSTAMSFNQDNACDFCLSSSCYIEIESNASMLESKLQNRDFNGFNCVHENRPRIVANQWKLMTR